MPLRVTLRPHIDLISTWTIFGHAWYVLWRANGVGMILGLAIVLQHFFFLPRNSFNRMIYPRLMVVDVIFVFKCAIHFFYCVHNT